MGRFGQPRYKDPLGTPAALRGIREVTDKNKHILLEAIFNGDFIPDHLLPVGIHRCGQQRWRAHLCTVGHKFSGPPRDTVRDACEDRRKFCEENGVNFVLYGKQTHAKGPIGSRPIVPSVFPRLSDYVASMSRGSTGGTGNSNTLVSNLKSNTNLRPFFDSIEETKRVLIAKKAEEEGTASYVVTKAHASLHRRIIEDRKDTTAHIYQSLQNIAGYTRTPEVKAFGLVPLSVEVSGESLQFLWSVDLAIQDPSLRMYIASFVGTDNQVHADIERVISADISIQINHFMKINETYNELMEKFDSIAEGVRYLQQHTPHVVHTRKATHGAPSRSIPESLDPVIEIQLNENIKFKWNVFTKDSVTEDFVRDLENDDDSISATDALFTIVDKSVRHRATLFQISKKSAIAVKPSTPAQDDSHFQFKQEDIDSMERAADDYMDKILSECMRRVSSR